MRGVILYGENKMTQVQAYKSLYNKTVFVFTKKTIAGLDPKSLIDLSENELKQIVKQSVYVLHLKSMRPARLNVDNFDKNDLQLMANEYYTIAENIRKYGCIWEIEL